MMFQPTNTVIGFIGTGVMGNSMAGHLLSAGYSLIIYTRSKEKAEMLLQKGANWANTPKEVAEKANVIFTMVGYPSDVEEVYLGEDGLITNGKENTYLLDMTTSTPSLAVKIQHEASKREFMLWMHQFPVEILGPKKPAFRLWWAEMMKIFKKLSLFYNY